MERPDAADRRHDTLSERLEVIRAIEPAVADHLRLLLPLDRAWQPADYLPDLEAVRRHNEVERFRTAAEGVSDELLVVLVGDMITEEALPSYSVALNGLVRDDEGTGSAPWARWLRGWTAEENRHGDLRHGRRRHESREAHILCRAGHEADLVTHGRPDCFPTPDCRPSPRFHHEP